ncbi:MAG: hypothetical protein IJ745_08140 [Bacteroidales bacterium]|nr:hypothetical protein [Bacteroidales bacterium]
MKKIIAIALFSAFGFRMPSVTAQPTYSQPVPSQVEEICLTGYASLTVLPTDGEMELQTATQSQVATVKQERLTIHSGVKEVALLLPAGRSVRFVAKNYSTLTFNGSFGKRRQLTVHTQNNARAFFTGALTDSVWAVDLSLQAEGYSQIHSDVRMIYQNYEVLPDGYAHISVDCLQLRYEPGVTTRMEKGRPCDNCIVKLNHCDDDSVGNHEPAVWGEGSAYEAERQSAQTRSFWNRRDVALNFTWGFHNWGTTPFNGFGGVDGDASIRTSFNHIHLSVDYPLVGTRHLGLYVGLGLEWDKYKFNAHEVYLNTDASPNALSDSGDAACSSWLNTRYVVVPLTLRIDLWHDWSLSLSALPGIHWGGSHTGLRRVYDTDLEHRTERDQSINHHLNPYRLDLRAMLGYENFGLYIQVPTMSAFRSSAEELYPVKFGFFLWLD